MYSSGTLVSGIIKSLSGYSQRFYRKETSNDSGVARHAHVLRSHDEVYSLCAVCITNLPDVDFGGDRRWSRSLRREKVT